MRSICLRRNRGWTCRVQELRQRAWEHRASLREPLIHGMSALSRMGRRTVSFGTSICVGLGNRIRVYKEMVGVNRGIDNSLGLLVPLVVVLPLVHLPLLDH